MRSAGACLRKAEGSACQECRHPVDVICLAGCLGSELYLSPRCEAREMGSNLSEKLSASVSGDVLPGLKESCSHRGRQVAFLSGKHSPA